jgi:hypothetical protein
MSHSPLIAGGHDNQRGIACKQKIVNQLASIEKVLGDNNVVSLPQSNSSNFVINNTDTIHSQQQM